MAKKKAGSRNRGKSLLGGESGQVQFDTSQIFIGIVDTVVKKDSEERESYIEDNPEISEYVDNRNTVYVVPIDRNTPDTVVKAHFVNSHNIDMPLPSEAVLCCKTSVGYIILDRFSPNAFGTNFELSDYLLSQKLARNSSFQGVSVQASQELKDRLGIKPIENVAPFFNKEGSKVMFGRNNQYMIFDYGERLEADSEEAEYSKDGSFVKIGLKRDGEQVDSKEDPSFVVVGTDAKIQSLLESNIESEFNVTEEEEPNNGIGIQSDQLLFFGRQFIVIYSQKDMLLHGENNLYMDFQEIVHKAERIKLGNDADEPVVKGNEMAEMIGDLIDIILNIKHFTSSGLTTGLDPSSQAKLRQFRSRHSRKNGAPYHSKRSFTD